MTRSFSWLTRFCCAFAGLFLLMASPAQPQDTPKPTQAAAPLQETPKPATVKAEIGKIVLETSLKGTVESEQTTELSLDIKSWTGPFIVKSAVAHGTSVRKGDVVLELDTVKIDQALNDIRLERELADLSLRLANEELPILEQSLPINLAAAEREKRIAEEDFKRYTEVERELKKKTTDNQVKSLANFLEYSREELKQLEKMYRDKDLTEETEEIIVKRQRNQIEMIEFMLESSKIQQNREETRGVPRRDQAMKESVQKQTMSWQKAMFSLPLEFKQKRLALQKQEIERAKTEERFGNLEGDRAAMIIRAPNDGIVFHGQAERGVWNTATVTSRLRRNGAIQPKEVVMTVVSARPVVLRADVEEKDLHALKEGLTGKAIPTGYPSLKLTARLKSLSLVPRAAGSFESRISLDIPDNVETILPGMTANVKFETYRNESAILIPTTSIFRDDGSDIPFVYVAAEGKTVKTEIETGKVTGNKTEVLSGLKAGLEILATKP